jgi:3-oxoacyl-[acyl-carrier protein] reductase
MFLQCARSESTIVIGISRNEEALKSMTDQCRAEGWNDAHLFAQDLCQPLSTGLGELIQSAGRIDLLVNNAGCLVNKPFTEITLEDMQRCYTTNVFGPMLLIQELYPWLSKSKQAHVVNIGSMGGVQGSAKFPGLSAYSSSKAALIGLGECIAEELKDSNIRINTVNLGAVQTEMLAEAFPGYIANHQADEVATWLINFGLNSGALMHGKSVMLSDSTP